MSPSFYGRTGILRAIDWRRRMGTIFRTGALLLSKTARELQETHRGEGTVGRLVAGTNEETRSTAPHRAPPM